MVRASARDAASISTMEPIPSSLSLREGQGSFKLSPSDSKNLRCSGRSSWRLLTWLGWSKATRANSNLVLAFERAGHQARHDFLDRLIALEQQVDGFDQRGVGADLSHQHMCHWGGKNAFCKALG